MIRGFMDGGMGRGWLPEQILSISVPQLLVLFGEHAPDAGEYLTADEQLAIVNERHAKLGLPPVKKRPRTFAEAAKQRKKNG